MFRKPQIVGLMFVIAAIALIAIGMKSPVMGAKSQWSLPNLDWITQQWSMSGHADESSEAFRHWDAEDDPNATISTSCARCHSTQGAEEFFNTGGVEGEYIATEVKGIECTVCHSDPNSGAKRNLTSVTFPSGITIGSSDSEALRQAKAASIAPEITAEDLGNGVICMQCHQGRESNERIESDVAAAIAAGGSDFDDDTISRSLRFRNVHYAQAGATNLGTIVMGGAQYPGKTYDAQFAHVDGYNDCTTCHDPHTLEVRLDNCATCHTDPGNTSYWGGIEDPKNIRYLGSCVDYDGDGNKTEGIYYEIDTLLHTLWDKISEYAEKVAGQAIAHGDGYPYFFNDTNGNGIADASEQDRANGFASYTVRLTRAIYNYQFASKDHGGYAHGGKYIIQLLYDGIEDLNEGLGLAAPEGLNREPNSYDGSSHQTRGDEGHFDGSTEAWRHWDGEDEVSSSCAKCHSATGLADYLDNESIDDTHRIANGMLCTTCHTSPPAMRPALPVKFPSGAILDLGDSSNLCMQCHQGRASKNTIAAKLAGDPPYTFSNIHYFPAAATFFGTEAQGAYEFEGKIYAGLRIFSNHFGRFNTCVQCHMGTEGLCDDCGSYPCNHNVQKPNPAHCITCHGMDISQPHNPNADPALFDFTKIRPGTTPDYDGDGNKEESVMDEIRGLEEALYEAILAYSADIGTPIVYESHSYPYWFIDTNGNGVADPDEATRSNGFSTFDANLLPAAYNYHTSKKEPAGYVHNSRYIAEILVDSIEVLGGDMSPYRWR